MFSFVLLGPPQILRDEQPIDIPRRKSRALLFYLAARSAPVTRERLLTIFWPEHERAAAQQVLRTTLHGLRKIFGDTLVSTNDSVALAPNIAVDSRRFEAQLGIANTPQALALTLALYQGAFLEEFDLPDSEPFERWQAVERERLHSLALRGFLDLAEQQMVQHNLPAALGTLSKALALDPLHEAIHRALMRVQYYSGDRAGAIRRYEQLRDQLDTELGVPPLAETRMLYDAIITDALAEQPYRVQPTFQAPVVERQRVPPNELPFIGRDTELSQIQAATRAGKLALLEGEPGIGKTRLARTWQHGAGGLALAGTAYELEQSLPYQPMIELLRGVCIESGLIEQLELPSIWRTEVARLLPELGNWREQPTLAVDESRLWEGVRQLLNALAQITPVTVLLDDLHWADDSSLALLGYLLRQPRSPDLRYIATTRPAASRSALATLIQTLSRSDRVVRIALKRLTSDETHALARRLSAHDGDLLATWLDRAAEGNPYMLAELVRHAREHTWLQPDGTLDRNALANVTVVPQSMYSMVELRLNALSPAARQVLDIAVAIGREFDYPVVAYAADFDEATMLNALDDLRTSGLIQPTTNQAFSFDHSLTMEVAYREIGEPRHRLMHRRVGEALESLYHDHIDEVVGVIAAHFAEGNEPVRAVPYAFKAGQQAAALAAWQEAISFFNQALTGQVAEQQLDTLLALGEAQTYGGVAAQASETFRRAIRLAERLGQLIVANATRIWLAQTLLPQSRYAEAISIVEPLLTTSEAANAEFFWGAALSLEGADLLGAKAHLQASARLLDATPNEHISLARVKFELAGIAAQQGDLHTAVQLYREVISITQHAANNERNWHILALNNLAYHLHLIGDQSALDYAQRGIALANEQGALSVLPYLYSTIGEIWLAANDLNAAEANFTQGLSLSEQLGMAERVAGITANLGRLAMKRGQPTLAIHHLSTALARADALGTQHLAAQIRIWLAPLLPPAQAHTTLAEARILTESGGRARLLAEIEQLGV